MIDAIKQQIKSEIAAGIVRFFKEFLLWTGERHKNTNDPIDLFQELADFINLKARDLDAATASAPNGKTSGQENGDAARNRDAKSESSKDKGTVREDISRARDGVFESRSFATGPVDSTRVAVERQFLANDHGLDEKTAARVRTNLARVPEASYPIEFKYYARLKEFAIITKEERQSSELGGGGLYDSKPDLPHVPDMAGVTIPSPAYGRKLFAAQFG